MANARIDDNRERTALAVNDTTGLPERLLVDASTGRLLIAIQVVTEPSSPTLNNSKIDGNYEHTALAVDSSNNPVPLHIDSRNGFLFADVLME